MIQYKTIGYTSVLAIAALALAGGQATAQERVTNAANANSTRPINENDIMMKKTLWRRIDLKEKQNQSMFSKNNEISKYLMEAVKSGLIEAYTNDSLTTKIDPQKFHENLLIPNTGGGLSEEEKAAGFKEDNGAGGDGWDKPKKDDKKVADDGWGTPKKAAAKTEPVDDGWGAPKKKTSVAKTTKGKKGAKIAQPIVEVKKDTVAVAQAPTFSGDEYFPKELNILEVREDWVFDKKRSRLYYDIQSVTLLLPADKNAAGYEKPIASFRFKDLDKLFRSDPKKFIWYNPQNQAQHKNLADAFDLRLFYGRITKVANPGDTDLVDMYGDREGLLKSYQTEYELMETEHGLWEY